jgi:hypothetical protein
MVQVYIGRQTPHRQRKRASRQQGPQTLQNDGRKKKHTHHDRGPTPFHRFAEAPICIHTYIQTDIHTHTHKPTHTYEFSLVHKYSFTRWRAVKFVIILETFKQFVMHACMHSFVLLWSPLGLVGFESDGLRFQVELLRFP